MEASDEIESTGGLAGAVEQSSGDKAKCRKSEDSKVGARPNLQFNTSRTKMKRNGDLNFSLSMPITKLRGHFPCDV